jgi:hypothetical protein
MKKTILIFAMCFTVQFGFSQIAKKSWLVGGNLAFKNINDLSTDYSTFQVSPNIGFFLWDKFALGSRLSFFKEYSESFTQKAPTITTIGPFVRYYFLAPEKMFNIYSQTSLEYTFIDKIRGFNYFSVLGGPVVFLNPNVALEFNVGYTTTTNFGRINDAVINTFQSGISLQIHINK